jgi:UV DNA damage endonuclease
MSVPPQPGLDWAYVLTSAFQNIRFMRMSSEMFPFASHPEYGYTLEYAAEELAAVGALATKYGHRLTTHPGQFTQLGSPRKEVVRNAVRDLTYHCEMIDRMGLGRDSIMIIHGGGMFNDKPATLARIKENYTNLLSQNIKDRLVLENDEMCYSAEDLLPLCEELQCPLVFDYHHHSIFPSSISIPEIIRRTNAIFAAKGIKPKQHLSEERPGAVTIMERRAHSDRCQNLPPDLPDDMGMPHVDF